MLKSEKIPGSRSLRIRVPQRTIVSLLHGCPVPIPGFIVFSVSRHLCIPKVEGGLTAFFSDQSRPLSHSEPTDDLNPEH